MTTSSQYCPIPNRLSLNHHLFHISKAPDQLRHLVIDISRAGKYIQQAIRTTEAGLAGTANKFGEDQLKLDVVSDDIIRQHLCENRTVAAFSSEERDELIVLDPEGKYTVVYDPLDGSSLVDVNFAIGSIFGIYEGSDVIGRTPREQVAAVYVIYGPRTLLIYSTGNGVHEFILNDAGEFVQLRQFLGVADDAKNFSPGNLSATIDTPAYAALMQDWMSEKMTLRYSGCMVADVHHVLSKGQGVFMNIGGSKYPDGKLRMLFECGPFAYLMDQAGGAASDGSNAILDKKIVALDQRTPIIIGSKNEVARCCKVLKA